jgi:hypothetical protein
MEKYRLQIRKYSSNQSSKGYLLTEKKNGKCILLSLKENQLVTE